MASRGLLAALALLVSTVVVAGSAASQPPTGTAIYVVRPDERLCPSPLCGGYWVAIANGARTRCADGLRRPRCYVARAVDAKGDSLGEVIDGSLVPGAVEPGREDFGELVTSAVYAPAGTSPLRGGYYRIAETGIRCIRAPCFSYAATQVNGHTRTTISEVELATARATAAQSARARRALRSANGLYARGVFVLRPNAGRAFLALRLYLRAPQPRA